MVQMRVGFISLSVAGIFLMLTFVSCDSALLLKPTRFPSEFSCQISGDTLIGNFPRGHFQVRADGFKSWSESQQIGGTRELFIRLSITSMDTLMLDFQDLYLQDSVQRKVAPDGIYLNSQRVQPITKLFIPPTFRTEIQLSFTSLDQSFRLPIMINFGEMYMSHPDDSIKFGGFWFDRR